MPTTVLAEEVKFTGISAPGTPAANHVVLYSKTGSKSLFFKDSDGVEHELGGGSGGMFISSTNRDASGGVVPAEPLTILRKSKSGTVCTLTLSRNHSWQVGQRITVVQIGAASLAIGSPSATDTVTIGADTYEWGGAGANINVSIGVDGYASAVNLAARINGSSGGTVATEPLLATVWMGADNATPSVLIQYANAVGGTPITGTPTTNILDADTGTWDVGNGFYFNVLSEIDGSNMLITSVSGAQLTYETIGGDTDNVGDSTASAPTGPYVSTCTRVAVPANIPAAFYQQNVNTGSIYLTYTPEITTGQEITLNLIATASLPFAVNPTAADYIVVGVNTWTFQAGASSGFNVQIKGSAALTLVELVTCINARATASVVASSGLNNGGDSCLFISYATGSTGSKTATAGIVPEPGVYVFASITTGAAFDNSITNLNVFNGTNTQTFIINSINPSATINGISYCLVYLNTPASGFPNVSTNIIGGTVAPGNLVSIPSSFPSAQAIGNTAYDIPINTPANCRQIRIRVGSSNNCAFSQTRGATGQGTPIIDSSETATIAVEPETRYFVNKNGNSFGISSIQFDIAES